MFTGIIESVGKVVESKRMGTNLDIKVQSGISSKLQIDQSISYNGVCLTVTNIEQDCHWVTAIDETLKKSSIGHLREGDLINLERCMKGDGRFDGHMVQGHVDTTAKLVKIEDQDGSWLFEFEVEETELLVEKGSVCVNGISLTCFDIQEYKFSIAIIPYTFECTNFSRLDPGDIVNIEFDIVGKYIQKILNKSYGNP